MNRVGTLRHSKKHRSAARRASKRINDRLKLAERQRYFHELLLTERRILSELPFKAAVPCETATPRTWRSIIQCARQLGKTWLMGLFR